MKVMSIWQKFSTRKSSNEQKHGRYAPVLLCVLSLLLPLAFFASLCFGSAEISLWDALAELAAGRVDSPDARILLYLRLPRAVGALLSGGALALAGVLIQAVLLNPMAAPNIIGVNAGAGLGVALILAFAPSAVMLLPLAAFLGAVAACLCIYAIASRTGADRTTVVLVGIAVSAILNAGINTVKTLFPDSVYDADSFMIGGLGGVTFSRLWPAVIAIVGALLCALFFARDADVLSLGDDAARSLGMNVKRIRFLLLALASVLAGSAVSIAGLLGFVGLVVPHVCRHIVGQNHRWLMPVSVVSGSVFVLVCDLLCRVLFAPYEVPVGILLSLIGGPFFVILILTGRRLHD